MPSTLHTLNQQHGMCLGVDTLSLLLVLLFTLSSGGSVLHAEAVTTIPGSWARSSYTCTFAEDCATSTMDTYHDINFSQMYTKAGSNRSTPAILYIEGLRIHVPVRIVLTGNEPSVVATFLKPYGTVTSMAAFLILGTCGAGTIITIDGGVFSHSGIASQYFHVTGALTLLGSTIIIKNVVTYNSGGMFGFFPITVRNGGSVQLYNNTMYISQAPTNTPPFRSVFSSYSLTLSEGSKVLVQENTVSYSTFAPKTPKLAVLLLTPSSTSPAGSSMTTGSQINVTGNYYSMNQITNATSIQLFCASIELGLTMSNSTMDIQSNAITLLDVQFASLRFTYLSTSTVTVSDASSIIVFNNSIDAAVTLLISTGTSKTQLAVLQDVSMNAGSTISIFQNSLVTTLYEGTSQGMLVYMLKVATLSLNSSQFLLRNNSITTSAPSAINYWNISMAQVAGVVADTTLLSDFEITSNRLYASLNPAVIPVDAVLLYISGTLNTLAKNTVLVAQNTFTLAPDAFNTNALVFLLSSGVDGSIITICANTVGINQYNKAMKTSTFSEPVTILCNPTMTPIYRTPTPSFLPTQTLSLTPLSSITAILTNALSFTQIASRSRRGAISQTVALSSPTLIPPVTVTHGSPLAPLTLTPPQPPPTPLSTAATPTSGPCNYSCTDIVALRYMQPNVLPQQAIDDYLIGLTNTVNWHGCVALSLPFASTANGDVARVLIHVASPLPIWNRSTPLSSRQLTTTRTGVIHAIGVLNTALQTQGGSSVVVVDIQRVDTNPTADVGGSIVLPLKGAPCGVDDTTSPPHEGLPWANIYLSAPPLTLNEGERKAVAVVAVTSADLQTVAAIGLLRCSPGSDKDVESEAGIRALVPVALSATCAGAVQGALLAVGVSGVLSVLVMCAVKCVKHLSWMDAAAMTRCPGLAISVWAFMQMGLVVCGARLATAEDSDNVVLGAVGIVAGLLLPVLCIGLAWGVVSRRCYRLTQVPGAVAGRHPIVVWARSVLLPSYEVDTEAYPVSKAFSSVVGRTRRPSCVWAGLPVAQPVIMLAVVFVQGKSCSLSLIITGVAMMLMGALCHILFRPHRIVASNYLQGVALALNAAVFFIASKLVSDPLNVAALDANSAIAMIQVGLSVCRFLHTMGYLVYMSLCSKGTLAVCSNDATTASTPTSTQEGSTSPCMPVFDIHNRLCCTERVATTNTDTMDVPLVARDIPNPAHHGSVAKNTNIENPFPSQSAAAAAPPPIPPSSRAAHATVSPTKRTATGRDAATGEDTPESNTKPAIKRRQVENKSKKFIWNPKEYVPMERPYTMLYEEDYDDDDGLDVDTNNSANQTMDLVSIELNSISSSSGSDSVHSHEVDGIVL